MSLKGILQELKKFNIDKSIEKSIRKNEAEILDLNIFQHTKEGVYNDDTLISDVHPYAVLTVTIKGLEGTLTNNNPSIVNLDDSGSFHSSFKIEKKGNDYYITSTDGKTSELEGKYSSEIFGLTDQNQNKVNEIILKDIGMDVHNALSVGGSK